MIHTLKLSTQSFKAAFSLPSNCCANSVLQIQNRSRFLKKKIKKNQVIIKTSPNPVYSNTTPIPLHPLQVSTRACTSRAQRPRPLPPRLLPLLQRHLLRSTPVPPPPAPRLLPVTTMAPLTLPTQLPLTPPLRSCWEITTTYG